LSDGAQTTTVPEQDADAPEHTVRFDDDGRIDETLPCRACGYDLRGLRASDVCPECAAAVQQSVEGDLLRFCDPTWVDRLARGTAWILWGILGAVACNVGFGILVVALAIAQVVSIGVLTAGLGFLLAGISLVGVLGVWFLTTPDPGHAVTAGGGRARTVARWCAMSQVVVAPLELATSGGGARFAGTAMVGIPTSLPILAVLAVLLAFVALVAKCAVLVYLRQLALRLPRPRLAGQTRLVAWGFGISQTLTLAMAVLTLALLPRLLAAAAPAAAPPAPAPVVAPGDGDVESATDPGADESDAAPPDAGTDAGPTATPAPAAPPAGTVAAIAPTLGIIGVGSCVTGLGSYVFGIWGIVLLFGYRSAFREASGAARARWG
jgi:hypothetical protein